MIMLLFLLLFSRRLYGFGAYWFHHTMVKILFVLRVWSVVSDVWKYLPLRLESTSSWYKRLPFLWFRSVIWLFWQLYWETINSCDLLTLIIRCCVTAYTCSDTRPASSRSDSHRTWLSPSVRDTIKSTGTIKLVCFHVGTQMFYRDIL